MGVVEPTAACTKVAFVRIALVSPYSWTYPGGVTRHIEALADELQAVGHEARILAPFDPADALARRGQRAARPQPMPLPGRVVPLGRTAGFPANGAISNLAPTVDSVIALWRELQTGGVGAGPGQAFGERRLAGVSPTAG